MTIEDRLIAVIGAFEREGIKCPLAGGFAYGIHLVPRATTDMDFLAVSNIAPDAVETVLGKVFQSVIAHKEPMRMGFVDLWRFVGFDGMDESVVDMLVPLDREFAESAVSRTIYIPFRGVGIPVVSLEDLYILKKRSERHQDVHDCDMMEKIRGDSMDWEYIRRWMKGGKSKGER